MLTIVIPTLNEEPRLPLLLESISKQNFNDDYEIIVADANSKDKTVEIAKNYGCKVIAGGLPAKGRNQGARIAKGDLLLFVDGDTILPQDFLSKNLKEFEERKIDVAGFRLYPYKKNRFFNFLYDLFYNWPALATEKILPHASNVILVKKSFHQRIGGFDEEIKIAEDHAYARAGAKIGRFCILRRSPTLAWTKRFERDGWVKTCFKYALYEFHMVFLGPVKSAIFRYRFGHYEEVKVKNPETITGKLARLFQIPWKTFEITTVLVVSLPILLISALWAANKAFFGRIAGRLRPCV
ncbi:MAG: glycosyltransferase [Chloroflexi bacterium]|nr:glycosyltransferase [Chloroflexota bacterium]